jgi:RNA-directed DNA polymerase
MTLLDDMAAGLGLPFPFIRGIARKASHAYKVYQIPKQSGGSREIAHPARPLKALQRWLLDSVIGKWEVHNAAFGYVSNRNIHQHASKHASSRYLLRMDFKGFFPSIRASDVRAYLRGRPPGTASWTDEDDRLFVQLVTRNGRLTIGAPTSPGLSNALCFEFDRLCWALAVDHEATYTRYADDLFFSTNQPDILREFPSHVLSLLTRVTVPAHLKLNDRKERHSSKKGRRQVTGIVLSSAGKAVLGRTRKRFIRRQVHRFDDLTAAEKVSLRGLISFATDVEATFINELILKYGHSRVMKAWKDF